MKKGRFLRGIFELFTHATQPPPQSIGGRSSQARVAATRVHRTVLLPLLFLILGLLLTATAGAITKTITVSPGVQINAVTTWYYANCTTSLGIGSYSISIAPQHGSVSFADVSGPLPGCPSGSPPLPATAAYYTWTDDTSAATTDHFQLIYSVNGLTETEDITVTLAVPPATESCDQILTSQTIASVPGQPSSRTTIGVAEVVTLNTTYPANWFISGNGILNEPTDGTCSLSTTATPVQGTQACFTAPYSGGQETITAQLDDGSGRECSLEFNIVAPTGVIYQRLTAVPYAYRDPAHEGKIGMWASLFVLPGNVSFANIGIAEDDVPYSQRHTTQVKPLLYTIPASAKFPAVNAWLIGCDLNLTPLITSYLSPFNLEYTWGSTDYLSAGKKAFATAETRILSPFFTIDYRKGEIPFGGSRFSSYTQPYAELEIPVFSKRSIMPDISGSCVSYVNQQFMQAPMSQ